MVLEVAHGPTYCDGSADGGTTGWYEGCGYCANCGQPIEVNPRTGRPRSRWFCSRGGGPSSTRSTSCRAQWRRNHVWPDAREAALKCDGNRCRRCPAGVGPAALGKGAHLEVNHIEPRRGAGYGTGCHHHQENLETLCITHHREETERQRQAAEAEEHA